MSSYASSDDVFARAGRWAGFFQIDGKHPDADDIDAILTDLSAEIDAAISARGFHPATISEAAAGALRDLAAYGALARALDAVDAGADAADLKTRAWAVWDSGYNGLLDGTNSVLVGLQAGTGGQQGPTAGDFWSDEPGYPTTGDIDEELLNPFPRPVWARGQSI